METKTANPLKRKNSTQTEEYTKKEDTSESIKRIKLSIKNGVATNIDLARLKMYQVVLHQIALDELAQKARIAEENKRKDDEIKEIKIRSELSSPLLEPQTPIQLQTNQTPRFSDLAWESLSVQSKQSFYMDHMAKQTEISTTTHTKKAEIKKYLDSHQFNTQSNNVQHISTYPMFFNKLKELSLGNTIATIHCFLDGFDESKEYPFWYLEIKWLPSPRKFILQIDWGIQVSITLITGPLHLDYLYYDAFKKKEWCPGSTTRSVFKFLRAIALHYQILFDLQDANTFTVSNSKCVLPLYFSYWAGLPAYYENVHQFSALSIAKWALDIQSYNTTSAFDIVDYEYNHTYSDIKSKLAIILEFIKTFDNYRVIKLGTLLRYLIDQCANKKTGNDIEGQLRKTYEAMQVLKAIEYIRNPTIIRNFDTIKYDMQTLINVGNRRIFIDLFNSNEYYVNRGKEWIELLAPGIWRQATEAKRCEWIWSEALGGNTNTPLKYRASPEQTNKAVIAIVHSVRKDVSVYSHYNPKFNDLKSLPGIQDSAKRANGKYKGSLASEVTDTFITEVVQAVKELIEYNLNVDIEDVKTEEATDGSTYSRDEEKYTGTIWFEENESPREVYIYLQSIFDRDEKTGEITGIRANMIVDFSDSFGVGIALVTDCGYFSGLVMQRGIMMTDTDSLKNSKDVNGVIRRVASGINALVISVYDETEDITKDVFIKAANDLYGYVTTAEVDITVMDPYTLKNVLSVEVVGADTNHQILSILLGPSYREIIKNNPLYTSQDLEDVYPLP